MCETNIIFTPKVPLWCKETRKIYNKFLWCLGAFAIYCIFNIRSVIIITFLNTFFKFQYHMLLHVLHSVFIEFNWLDFYILKLSCSNPQLENIHILKFNQVSINYFGFLLMSAFITIVSSLTLHSLWFNCSLSILFVILETKYSLLQNTSCLIQLKRCCLCIFYLIILYQ